MPIGPGKYDDVLTVALKTVKAKQGILIVVDGNKGPGFSAQLDIAKSLAIPAMLRNLADQIEADIKPKT